MSRKLYKKLRETAKAVADTLPQPAFYKKHAPIIHRVDEMLATHELILKCRAVLDEYQLECAHGLCHCETVARDAGALILIEASSRGLLDADTVNLCIIGEIAGLLHDIKRKEKNHALLGSIEAEKILAGIGMNHRDRKYISDAIRNHEAFKETFDALDEHAQLVSDALYDADKFRWGPENFTTTLWLIVEDHQTVPETLHKTFREKMKGIEKIKETFRTATGRRFGPEFIDQGLTIGNAIYDEMSEMLR